MINHRKFIKSRKCPPKGYVQVVPGLWMLPFDKNLLMVKNENPLNLRGFKFVKAHHGNK